MANVANCKKCGALFLQTSNKIDVCDKCFEKQNKLLADINTFVTMYPDAYVSLDIVLEKFNLTRDEFEVFYAAGKFVKIAQKVTMKCVKCGKIVPLAGKTNMLCNACTKKLQNEI